MKILFDGTHDQSLLVCDESGIDIRPSEYRKARENLNRPRKDKETLNA